MQPMMMKAVLKSIPGIGTKICLTEYKKYRQWKTFTTTPKKYLKPTKATKR